MQAGILVYLPALLVAFVFFVGLLVLYEGSRLIIALWLAVAINEVGLFFGPTVVRLRLPQFAFRINTVPLGGYISFAAEHGSGAFRPYLLLRSRERLCLHLAPLVTTAVIASLLSKPANGWHELADFLSDGEQGAMQGRKGVCGAPAEAGKDVVNESFIRRRPSEPRRPPCASAATTVSTP
jgi:hypothetical protein